MPSAGVRIPRGQGPKERNLSPAPQKVLEAMLKKYRSTRRPLKVSFRELLPTRTHADTATHLIHPYPAKLLSHIPRFMLETKLARPTDAIYDPFCGSGTVLLEGMLSGRNVLGADANPLARLITQVKLTPIEPKSLASQAHRLFTRLDKVPCAMRDDVLNVDYWF